MRPEQEAAIRNAWAERQKKHQQIKTAANNIAKVAGDYGEVDYSTLQKYIDAGDLSAMQTETKKVAQAILAAKKAEQALADIIPNVHSWHQQFTMAELQGVYDAVNRRSRVGRVYPSNSRRKSCISRLMTSSAAI